MRKLRLRLWAGRRARSARGGNEEYIEAPTAQADRLRREDEITRTVRIEKEERGTCRFTGSLADQVFICMTCGGYPEDDCPEWLAECRLRREDEITRTVRIEDEKKEKGS